MQKTLSKIGYLMMVGGLAGLLILRDLFSDYPAVIVFQAAAVLLMLWARLTFGVRSFHFSASPTEGGLVTSGPYRLIRHPIYASVCLFIAAGVAAHFSAASAALCTLALAGAIVRIKCEEILLLQQYPDYGEYSTKSWRMFPYVY